MPQAAIRAIESPQEAALHAAYLAKGYAVIPRFIDPELAAAWEFKHRLLPGREVHIGDACRTVWTEQLFSNPSDALDGMPVADWFIELTRTISGLNSIDNGETQVWINRYKPGDHVPMHCDRDGDTQFLLCLHGLLEPEKGGDLIIQGEPVPLQTGDAVLFFARGVPHATTPIGSARVGACGFSRITCVIRLFAAHMAT